MPINEYGFEVDENGDLVRTATGDYQRTPGAVGSNAHMGTDSRGLQWMSNNATGGEKSFLSPYARGIYDDPHDHDKSFFRGGSQWNSKTGEWEKGGLDWGNILSMVVAGTLTAGAADAIMGASAGTANALIDSGAAAVASPGGIAGASLGMPAALPGAVSGIAAPAASVGAASAFPALQGVTSGMPNALPGALATPAAPTAATVPDWSGPKQDGDPSLNNPGGSQTGKVLRALAALGGAAGGRALSNQAGSGNVPPELQQMLALALSRAKSQQPLFDASNRGMYEMLPNFARTPTAQFPGGG